VTWDPSGRAEEFRRALFERGAAATVIQRFVEVPVLPPVDVMLDEAGENKVAVMKVVREYVNVGLVEAKHLVESAPCVLIQGLEGTRAHAFRDALVALGAKARTIA
jgi:ribosomal protein L7/L12